MSILLRRTSALLALLALTLCLPQGSLMLCASENGHVAIEAACGDDASVAHAEAPSADVAGECDCDSGCGPCQDAKVGTELSAGRTREHSSDAPDLLVAPMVFTSRVAQLSPRALAPARCPAPAGPMDPLARVRAGVQLRI